MIAIDTNVVLRVILDDDEAQIAVIRRLMLRETLFVSLGVLLETGWVLESRYELSRTDVADALELVIELESIVVPRQDSARWAIARYRAGADLADVMHLASALKIARFATFDRRLRRDAGSDSPVAIENLG